MIEAQDKTIANLLKAVKEQHDQLDYQKIKITNLEEKVLVQESLYFAFKGKISEISENLIFLLY